MPGHASAFAGAAARAARAEPDQRRDAERGHQPDGVPVAERRAQPRVGLRLGQPLREDLRQQRPARDEDARERDPVQHRVPAAGREPGERHRPGEGHQVGERPAALDPRVRRRQRPEHGDGGVRGQQRDEQQRGRAVQLADPRPGHEQRRRAQRGAEQHHERLDDRRALQAQAAVGAERGAGEDERDPEADQQPGAGAAPAGGRSGHGTAQRRRGRLRRADGRGHAGGRRGRPRRPPRARGGSAWPRASGGSGCARRRRRSRPCRA